MWLWLAQAVWVTAGTEDTGDKEASVTCGTRQGKETSFHDPEGEHRQLSIIPGGSGLLQSWLLTLLTVTVLFQRVCFGGGSP